MIVLGNPDFATGMKLAGLKESYAVRKREDVLELLSKVDQKEFIIANVSVFNMLPELAEFSNVVTMPDDVSNFGNTDDLKHIIKSAVGIELNI